MKFIEWMNSRNKFLRVILSLVGLWRAVAIIDAIVNKKPLATPIVFAVFCGVFAIFDFFCVLAKDHAFML